jgi:hypothetical protein
MSLPCLLSETSQSRTTGVAEVIETPQIPYENDAERVTGMIVLSGP